MIAGRPLRPSLRPCRRLLDGFGWPARSGGRSSTTSVAPGGCDRRPGLDALLTSVAHREFDIVAAWSVCRLGRSLSDLIGLLGELRRRDSIQGRVRSI